MAIFNLVWFDPLHIEKNKRIKELLNKERNYTLEDRIEIIDIQRKIMQEIIPAYKKALDENKIEISTSPYYHPILPLLINADTAKKANKSIDLPEIPCVLKEDAKRQLLKSINKTEELFGKKPKGIWLPELCINNDTLKMLMSLGIEWTITDEGILAKTLKKDFVRNYRGIMEDPFELCQPYKYKHSDKEINLVIRNAILSDLISFEYANFDYIVAANDLYDRIKTAQDKLEVAPLDKHLIVIAMDGENCWENYKNDGIDFLRSIYTLLNNDNTIEVTTVNEFLKKGEIHTTISDIAPGSWINANFDMWIGEPTKNFAWNYLNKAKQDCRKALEENSYYEDVINSARQELLKAEGSDWFWWYGEPNSSGRDEIFDYLFRSHLKNMYNILNLKTPSYLNIELETFIGKPSKHPKGLITPTLNGIEDDDNEWVNAGRIEIPQSPTIANKMVDTICYGNDKDNLYIKIDFNRYYMNKFSNITYGNEFFIYCAKKSAEHYSSIRLRNKTESVPQILKYLYTHEIQVPTSKERISPVIFSEAIENSLWKVIPSHNINYFHQDVLELQIPFDDLKVASNEGIYIIFLMCHANIINQIVPLDNGIYIERP